MPRYVKCLLALLVCAVTVTAFVAFANPQLNRWIYALQAYGFEFDSEWAPDQIKAHSCKYDCKHNKYLKPRDNYSGSWVVYCDYGHPIWAAEFQHGQFVQQISIEPYEIHGADYGIMFDNMIYERTREEYHE